MRTPIPVVPKHINVANAATLRAARLLGFIPCFLGRDENPFLP
jgi:hypothetical protein